MTPENLTLADWITRHAALRPADLAARMGDATWTWRAWSDEVDAMTGALLARDVRPGDRVVARTWNDRRALSLMAACGRVGAIYVPAHARWSPAELDGLTDDARPALWVEGDGFEGRGVPWSALEGTPAKHREEVTQETPALLMYTSGTTGRARGAVLTHGALLWNAMQLALDLELTARDTNLAVAPLFHIAGLNVLTTPSVYVGAANVFRARFEPETLEADVEGVTTAFMVPAMWRRLGQLKAFGQGAFDGVRIGVVGGAPPEAALLEAWWSRGVELAIGYGFTEAGPHVTIARQAWWARDPEMVGPAAGHVRVEVRGLESGEVLPDGEVGQLWARAPNLMQGYWAGEGEAPDRGRFDADGWFASGDLGWRGADGALRLVDRLHNMIISGGENVYPAEVERALRAHPEVADVAVLGRPDQKFGERVVAIVVWREEVVGLEVLRDWAQGRLSRFKLPRELVTATKALPRLPTGKLDRRTLAALVGM